MPSKTKEQHNLMAAVAKNPAFAKKVGIPTSVGQDFLNADKGRKFKEGGDMKESKAMVKKEVSFMKKKGAPASMIKHEMGEMKGMKKMAGGGMAKMGAVRTAAPSKDGVAAKGKTKGAMVVMKRGGKAC